MVTQDYPETQWAQPRHVKLRWVSPDPLEVDEEKIYWLLESAEDKVLKRFPDLPARLKAGTIKVRTVRRIVVDMVFRVLQNPEGIRAIQGTSGPFGGSTTFGGDHPGQLVLTSDEIEELRPSTGRGRTAHSIMPNY